MNETLTDGLTVLLMGTGSAFMLLTAVGLLRLPDALCRSHAVSKAMTAGIACLLLAVWLQVGTEKAGLKVLLALVFQITTIPLASHLLALVAYRKRLPRWRNPKAPPPRPDR
jgi:multicomponent Na+:H+ antiporter subunit G